jgi:hypothetical protein
MKRLYLTNNRLIFLGIAPIAVVSWLNLKIYLTIKQSGMGTVRTLKAGDSGCQGDELIRNISMVKNNEKQQMANVKLKKMCKDETFSSKISSESVYVSPVIKQEDNGNILKRLFCNLNNERIKNQDETNTGQIRKNERVQFITLFSIIFLFILCNIPRISLLLHQVIIMDTIK